jgi:hypothetical protein
MQWSQYILYWNHPKAKPLRLLQLQLAVLTFCVGYKDAKYVGRLFRLSPFDFRFLVEIDF